MIIRTTSGKTINLLFSAANCTGYRAVSIKLERRDILSLINMIKDRPTLAVTALAQLHARFPSAPESDEESVDQPTVDYKELYEVVNYRLGQIHEVVRVYQAMPENHTLVQCPNKCNGITHQHFDYCGICASCGANLVTVNVASLLTANPPKNQHRTIYLSGPMTGLPEFNYPRFHEVTQKLREKGHIVYNPAEFPHHGSFPIRQAFAEYTAFICNRADTMVMLDGWHGSKGAKAEHALAENCNLDIIYPTHSDEDLISHLSEPADRK